MINYEEMPKNNRDLAKIDVSFPYLRFNSPLFCPRKMSEILKYLQLEAASEEPLNKKDLHFIRTAQVAEERYWIWEFYESDNKKCYVTVSQAPDGSTCVGYDVDDYGLTPEQFILGTYHNVF